MKLHGSLLAGVCVGLAGLYYWLAMGHTALRHVPLLYRFTFRLFPWADILWTIAAAALLYRGIQQVRSK
jgi:hypothetical protein